MNGATHSDWSHQHWRFDHFPIQKTQHNGKNWSWGTSDVYSDERTVGFELDTTKSNLPISNCMVRSCIKRRASRRQLSLRILEARYPCRKRKNASRTALGATGRYKGRSSEQTGYVNGDKHAKDENRTTNQKNITSAKKCRSSGQRTHDASRSKVFQSMGFLISTWLEPVDVLRMKQTYKCNWEWRHCLKGNISNTSAKYVALMQNGMLPETLLAECKQRDVFDAIWYLPVEKIVQLAYAYQDYKTIRKLSYIF